MRSRSHSWTNILTKLGFTRRKRRHAKSCLPGRSLRMEPLEDRRRLATLTVNTDADTILSDPDSVLSLREAILVANSDSLAGLDSTEQLQIDTTVDQLGINDKIIFDSSLDGGTILLTLGALPTITESVTIDTTDPNNNTVLFDITIDASGNDPTPLQNNGDGSRIFDIEGNAEEMPFISVTLKGLRLTGGDVAETNNFGNGGAIRAVYASLAIDDSIITGNHAAGDGGGIYATYSCAA